MSIPDPCLRDMVWKPKANTVMNTRFMFIALSRYYLTAISEASSNNILDWVSRYLIQTWKNSVCAGWNCGGVTRYTVQLATPPNTFLSSLGVLSNPMKANIMLPAMYKVRDSCHLVAKPPFWGVLRQLLWPREGLGMDLHGLPTTSGYHREIQSHSCTYSTTNLHSIHTKHGVQCGH